ncbi:MAG: hypothetical protein J6B75_02095 [Ruminococcus sp.]|nr:hypothetical protein [Ruminococcus sp.]
MWINDKWYSDTEVQAYIEELKEKITQQEKFINCVRSYYSENISWDDLFEEDYMKLAKNIRD